MTKILVRAHADYMKPHSIDEVLAKDLFGHNPGNWLFLYGVLRAIVDDDITVDFTTGYAEDLNDARIERYNNEYDYFLMPLANVFKADWEEKLKALTFLVKRLDMPCIVVGMGLQSDSEDGNFDFSFNQTAKNFMDAVLSKSSIIGIRGEYTAKYLEYLGYRRDRDFMIIGCPSMYSFGMHLPKIKGPAVKPGHVIINTNPTITSEKYNAWFEKFIGELEDKNIKYSYIPQRLDELRLIRYGTPMSKNIRKIAPTYFPTDTGHPLYEHEVGVNSVESWLEYTKTADLTIGTRIHGCIASILCGVPALVICKDTRMTELATFFNIPHISIDDIDDNFDALSYCEKIDYAPIYAKHRENFENFVRFLDLNKIPHIYRENIDRKDFPFDRLSENKEISIYYPTTTRDSEEVNRTLLEYTDYLQDYARRMEKDYRHKLLSIYTTKYQQSFSIKNWKKKAEELEKKVEMLEKQS